MTMPNGSEHICAPNQTIALEAAIAEYIDQHQLALSRAAQWRAQAMALQASNENLAAQLKALTNQKSALPTELDSREHK